MADIFLSYAREDWESVRSLTEALETEGWSVWWDTRIDPGQHFDQVIETQIAAARGVLVVWTGASTESQWARAEAAEALDQHKLTPAFLDNVRAPLLLRHVQGLDFKAWTGSPDDPAFLRLTEEISQLTGSPLRPMAVEAETDGGGTPAAARELAPSAAAEARPSIARSGQSAGRGTRASDGAESEMVCIERAAFLMGRPDGEVGTSPDELPQNGVRIARPFAIGRYAVTFDEYDTFARLTKRQPPSDQRWGHGRRPVINVSWEDAVANPGWLSARVGRRYRLPTEAEWEYAARAGAATAWSFGRDVSDLDRHA